MVPTDITSEVYSNAKKLFSELWDKQTPLRLLGVSLTDLTREGHIQQSFFGNEEKEQNEKLDKAIDHIRKKYGLDTISRGSLLHSNVEVSKKYRAQMERKKEK